MSHSARTRSHAPNESAANRFKSNRARSTRDTWLRVRVISSDLPRAFRVIGVVGETIFYNDKLLWSHRPRAKRGYTNHRIALSAISLPRSILYASFLFAILFVAPTLFLFSLSRCTDALWSTLSRTRDTRLIRF